MWPCCFVPCFVLEMLLEITVVKYNCKAILVAAVD